MQCRCHNDYRGLLWLDGNSYATVVDASVISLGLGDRMRYTTGGATPTLLITSTNLFAYYLICCCIQWDNHSAKPVNAIKWIYWHFIKDVQLKTCNNRHISGPFLSHEVWWAPAGGVALQNNGEKQCDNNGTTRNIIRERTMFWIRFHNYNVDGRVSPYRTSRREHAAYELKT